MGIPAPLKNIPKGAVTMSELLTLKGTNGVSEIHIESGLLAHAASVIGETFSPSRIHIVSDSTVAPLYLEQLEQQFTLPVTHTVIPAGEEHKRLSTVEGIYHDLLANGMTRKDLIIALGGGVVGDITGFAAATFLRGVSLCQIPTTLLAQVDSSVGGKTGVDMPEGKNLVGAFYQPRLVLIDPAVLATLPDQTFADGMAEVVKYGYISNREILDMVSAPDYKKNIERIICECVRIKRDVVTIDEHDTGLRMILNFGHTIGHAAEKARKLCRPHARSGRRDRHGRGDAPVRHARQRGSVRAPHRHPRAYRSADRAEVRPRGHLPLAAVRQEKKFGATVNFILVREPGRAEITPIGAEKLHEYVLKL